MRIASYTHDDKSQTRILPPHSRTRTQHYLALIHVITRLVRVVNGLPLSANYLRIIRRLVTKESVGEFFRRGQSHAHGITGIMQFFLILFFFFFSAIPTFRVRPRRTELLFLFLVDCEEIIFVFGRAAIDTTAAIRIRSTDDCNRYGRRESNASRRFRARLRDFSELAKRESDK